MRVVVAIDDSECSNVALEAVISKCWPAGTEFRVLNVVEPLYYQYPFAGYAMVPMIDAQQDFEKYHRKFVDEKAEYLKRMLDSSYKITGEILEGPAPSMIVDFAAEWNADLIMVGSHGRRGFQKFFLGSVAEKVASSAPCSVEIVKAKTAAHPAEMTENASLKEAVESKTSAAAASKN